ncbi:MAG TPA: pantetheine-phosphate adenylyltransferase [Candidatus Methylacidiphilales bacterium]|nr:pantetheine-phosphate adenylyltransferase [Candidatus Methylacidiphilales bacterium]
MRRAVYPGTFDPITNGHLDVAGRALKIFDELIIAIAVDNNKVPLFGIDERLRLVQEAAEHEGLKVRAITFSGLLVNFVREHGACAVIRGLRAVSDFEFEFQLALMNRKLDPEIETLFLMPRDTYTYLSSSIIKGISRLGGPVSDFVPPSVETALKAKYHHNVLPPVPLAPSPLPVASPPAAAIPHAIPAPVP